MKKSIKIILGVVAAALIITVLVFPVKKVYPDGGTVFYRALTYCRIEWNVKQGYNNTHITGEEWHFFPTNFKSYGDYYKPAENVTLGITTEPIQIYCIDGDERNVKITNSELMGIIVSELNSANYTYLRKTSQEEADASISVYIRNVSREVFYIEIIDAYTVNLEGYMYQSDRELPYEYFNQILGENNP